jgi:plasmid stabilization system protein ParE
MTSFLLSVSPKAEEETRGAAQWYEQRSRGLGAAFLEILEQTLAGIVENPLRFSVVHRDLRRALMKRFPYGVFFRLRADRIRVLAVVHLSRDPDHWRRRT